MIAKPLVVLAALATTGCFAPREEWGSMDMSGWQGFTAVDFGSVEIVAVNVTRLSTLPDQVAARITATFRLTNAEGSFARITLDDAGCPYGPPSAPVSPVATTARELPRGYQSELYTVVTTMRGNGMPDVEGSVFVWAEAENAIGPIFGECREFLRVP